MRSRVRPYPVAPVALRRGSGADRGAGDGSSGGRRASPAARPRLCPRQRRGRQCAQRGVGIDQDAGRAADLPRPGRGSGSAAAATPSNPPGSDPGARRGVRAREPCSRARSARSRDYAGITVMGWTAPNGISVSRLSLSPSHLKGSRPWASLSPNCRLSRALGSIWRRTSSRFTASTRKARSWSGASCGGARCRNSSPSYSLRRGDGGLFVAPITGRVS